MIVAALPREIAELVRGAPADPTLKRSGIHRHRLPGAVVVCGGMGAERVTLALSAGLELGPVSVVVSAGLAGACDPALPAGSLITPRTIVDALSGVRSDGVPDGAGTLVTTHTIAGVAEKQRLHAAYGAVAVDMEAAIVARLAGAHGLPFRAVKAISDAHDFEMRSLSRFTSAQGHFRTRAFALHTVLRPRSWRPAMTLGAGSRRALHALAERLRAIIEEEDAT